MHSAPHRSRRVLGLAGAVLALMVPTAISTTAGAAPATTLPSLRAEATQGHLLFGAGATNPAYLQDPRFAQTLASQFNSLSPENEMKWSQIEPQRGVFDFSKIDQLVAFAQDHDMAVKGHGLVSGGFNPTWLTNITDPAEVRAVLKNHFETIMHRYAGVVDRWDVMTEAFSTFGGTGLTKNFWYDRLGPDYIAELFRIAHAADPSAKLFFNESLVEYYPTKSNELYELVSTMVRDGVPISGIGLEMHETLYGPLPGAVRSIVQSYRKLGLEVAITEMDVHVYSKVQQALIYGRVLREALAAGVTDISFWGFTDAHLYTWLPGAKPLMFDEQYQPKPAFWATWHALDAAVPESRPKR